MANLNSVFDVINRQNNGQPITISATGTLHQSFLLGGVAAVGNVPNPMASINAPELYPGLSADGRPFIIRAAGKVTGGEKYQIDICQGSGLTPVLASTGLSQNGLTADNWLIEAEVMFDSVSGFLRGIQYGWAGPTAISQAALSQTISGLTLATLTFSVAATIASANANALLTLTEFSAEYV